MFILFASSPFLAQKNVSLWQNKITMEETKDINRIKVVLVEKKKSNKWLAEQLGKDPATISKWCTNTSQPTIETLLKIAEVLGVNYTELVRAKAVNVQN